MEIRKAVIGEVTRVVELINELIIELGGAPLPVAEAAATVNSFISGELDGSIIVASNDDDLAGVCTLTFQPSIRTLGKYAIVELSTPPNGERAENFYRRVGFSQVGVRMRHKFEDPTP